MKRHPVEALKTPATPKPEPLNSVEIGIIHLFVQLARALNQPPSVAEVYGLLFASPRPVNQDEAMIRLNLSKGAASQGLRYLLDLGAVRTVYVAADRRAHYEAVAQLRHLAGRFLRQQVMTYFDDGGSRLDRIAAEAQKLSGEEREFALDRVRLLRSWSKNAKKVLPIVLAILGGGSGKNGK